MFYELKITKPQNETDEPIEIVTKNVSGASTHGITDVEFKVATVPDHVSKRSSELNVNIIITGEITLESDDGENNDGDESTNEMCERMLKWSISSTSDYRNLKLTMLSDNSEGNRKVIREYHIKRVFCVDYTEQYGENITDKKDNNGTTGKYILELRQEGGRLNEIKAFSK